MTKVLGICGGSGSGKTTLARMIRERLGREHCAILYQDSYYKDQSHLVSGEEMTQVGVNFDHPDAIDFSLMSQHISELKKGNDVDVPYYDFSSHARLERSQHYESPDLLIVDGILIFAAQELKDSLDYRIFLNIPESVRFERRLKRDVQERGRTEAGVRDQFFHQVAPMHKRFVDPSSAVADIQFSSNKEAVEGIFPLVSKLLPNLDSLRSASHPPTEILSDSGDLKKS